MVVGQEMAEVHYYIESSGLMAFPCWVVKGFVTAGSGLYFHKPEINGEVDELRRLAFQEGYKVGQGVGHR